MKLSKVPFVLAEIEAVLAQRFPRLTFHIFAMHAAPAEFVPSPRLTFLDVPDYGDRDNERAHWSGSIRGWNEALSAAGLMALPVVGRD